MTAYYNEIEPYAAAWLRNLIAEGLIAPGDVDERSIVDVQSRDLAGYTQCHFFAGIGGWSLAAKLAGWSDDRPLWTGSCPCQPLSSAGRRKGHADRRHLWPAFFGLIAECRPPVVFGEQVAGPDGREWFAGVRADLEATSYACGAADLCAASAGAPHQRQRLFWCAHDHRDKHLGEGRPRRPDFETAERQAPQGFTLRDRRFSELVAMDVAEWAPAYAQARELVDGIPGGVEQLRAFGNAIVPQVAAEVIGAFMDSTS